MPATVRIIRSAGYRVLEAATGKDCIRMAKERSPDMILLDVVLPDIMGTEVCRQIKTDPFFEGTFVILISGVKTASCHQTNGLDTGADGYIARPDIPIIVCTGFSEKVNEKIARDMGIRGYLMKPIVISQLACMLRSALDGADRTPSGDVQGGSGPNPGSTIKKKEKPCCA